MKERDALGYCLVGLRCSCHRLAVGVLIGSVLVRTMRFAAGARWCWLSGVFHHNPNYAPVRRVAERATLKCDYY